MEPRKGFYSVVQYCPDHSRMEAANVGVVLFVPDVPEARFIKAKMAPGSARVSRFFGSQAFDPKWLKAAKKSLAARLEVAADSFETLENLNHFVATRANRLVLTEPRPVKVRVPEEELERLFGELVDYGGAEARPEAVIPYLDTAFHGSKLAPRMLFDEKVTIPVVNKTIHVPYAYHNGSLNLVRPIAVGPRGVDQYMLALATEGNLIQTQREGTRLIVVPEVREKGSPRVARAREALSKLFGVYDIRTVWEEDRPGFIEEVDREAHTVPT